MKTNRIVAKVVAIAAITLGCGLLCCSRLVGMGNNGGTETGEARLAGVLYNSCGSFAAHATVKALRWNRSPRDNDVVLATTETDQNGVYSFSSPPFDTFNIICSGDSGFSYHDSIVVNGRGSSIQLPSDTLKPAGSIRGSISLQNGEDPRTVIILFMGTTTWTEPNDSNGAFSVSNLAAGDYRVRILPTLGNYQPQELVLSVVAGKAITLPDPIPMTCGGISAPRGFSAVYDSLDRRMLLTWKPVAFPDLAGYVVYRIDSVSQLPQRIAKDLVTDTFFIDTGVSKIKDTLQFTYSVKAQDKKGNLSVAVSIQVVLIAPSRAATDTSVDSSSVIKVVAGNLYSFFLRGDNSLWACGYNERGQLGDGTTTSRSSPVKVMEHVKDVDVGISDYGSYSHNLILKNDKTLWACGSNYMNVISDNSNGDNYPTPVQKMADVIDMSAGGMYGSLFIKSDNTLWSCGKTSLFSVPDNDPVLTSYSVPSQIMSHVQDVDVGYGFGMIIKEDRTLWGYGYNPYIRLGDVATVQADTPVLVTTEVKSVSTGNLHSLILKTDGTLWACGSNSSGQLGDGTTTNRSVPVQVMTGVKSMSAGYNFSLILKNDGTLWACGSNKAGELCDGTTSTRLIPVQVMTDVKGMSAGGGYGGAYYTMGTSHSLILKNDGTVWACGCNEYGQLGDGTTTASPTPKLISLPTK